MKRFTTQRSLSLRGAALSTVAIGLLSVPAIAAQQPDRGAGGHVLCVESNDTRHNRNAIFAFGLGDDGSLHQISGSPFATGGTGFFDPSFALGPFDNDQQLVLSADDNTLYAVNGGSNSVSALHVSPDGRLSPLLGWPVRSGGSTPVSIGQQGSSLVVLNSSEDPAQAATAGAPGAQVIDVLPGGFPLPRPLRQVDLPKGSDPTQVLTTNTGRFLFGTGFPAGGSVAAFARQSDGKIVSTDDVLPPQFNGVQALALGLWAHPTQPYLYVGFVNVNQLGVYRWDTQGHLHLVRAVANSGQGLCWLRTTRDGRFLLTSNTVDDSVSVYDLADPANPVEITRAVGGGSGGYYQLALSPDERHVYVLEQEVSTASAGNSNKLHVFDFDPSSGALSSDPGKTVALPVDATTRPFGLAIR